MAPWWLVGGLVVAIAVIAWRWRLTHRERMRLRAKLERAHARRRETEKQKNSLRGMPLLVEASFDALVLVNSERRLVALNQAARDLFSPTGDPIGQTLVALTRHHEIDALTRDALAGSEDLDRQITIDGRPFRVRALVLPDPSGAWVSIALRDVSELQRLARARRDMVANISHELRTPITSIRLLVDTLISGALHDTTQIPQLLDKIAAETSILQQMAQELLDLSMIESGKAIVRLVPRPVDGLLRDAISHLSEQAKRKRQTITHEPCEELVALADPEMVNRVLTNLLHNAVKFAPEGSHVRIGCQRDGEWVRISVTDDGPGISHADRERVFERFYRADRARGGPGTGLGLAIAKHIVEAHGGQIWVAEREIGETGARLRFTLPLARREAPPSAADT